MFCFVYVCHCLYIKGSLKMDFDFDKNHFVSILEVQNGRNSNKFVYIRDTNANDFDFYVCCSPCFINLIEPYDFRDEMQKECFNEIFSFLNERAGNRILRGEFLFHEWDLCGKCFSKIIQSVRQDFNSVYCTNIRK